MSRSHKLAIIKYMPSNGTWGKDQANRKVRRAMDVPDGSAYKKIFCSWNIHDHTFFSLHDNEFLTHSRKTGRGYIIPK